MDAEHEESSPEASTLLISQLSCSLVGQVGRIRIMSDTHASQIYGRNLVEENFYCNYGLNNDFRDVIAQGALIISGIDDEGDVRIVELPAHPFFVGTLFLPQAASHPGEPHPVITAFLQAALDD